jgi:phage baseplate assembly protein W
MLSKIQKYSDLPFFMSPNGFTRDLNLTTDLSAIRQSIKNIILTNNGERFFNYSFGSNLYSSIFENYTLELIIDIQSKIANNIRAYERRVDLNDVRVLDNPKENAVSIVVDFNIPEIGKNDVIVINLARNR